MSFDFSKNILQKNWRTSRQKKSFVWRALQLACRALFQLFVVITCSTPRSKENREWILLFEIHSENNAHFEVSNDHYIRTRDQKIPHDPVSSWIWKIYLCRQLVRPKAFSSDGSEKEDNVKWNCILSLRKLRTKKQKYTFGIFLFGTQTSVFP